MIGEWSRVCISREGGLDAADATSPIAEFRTAGHFLTRRGLGWSMPAGGGAVALCTRQPRCSERPSPCSEVAFGVVAAAVDGVE
jgi:hypothetical protein